MALTTVGLSAGVGRSELANSGAVPTWRCHWMAVSVASGNVPWIVAGAGWLCLMLARIFSSVDVTL